MFKQSLLITTAVIAVFNLAQAQEDPLLDLLVKKKVLTAKEADNVRADIVKIQPADDSADKLKVASWVKEMTLSGDLRLRYQYDNRDFQVDPPGAGNDNDGSPSGSQTSRYRFRLRLRSDFKLNDNWFGGVELATSPAADSSNQTFGSGFGKYDIFISRAYLGWTVTDAWLTMVAGKVPNPFYTTPLVWDPDIAPDGLAQTIRFHKMFLGSSEAGYGKDGKTIADATPEDRPWELTLNLGEFVFSDNNEQGNISGSSEPGLRDNDVADDAWLFEGQLVASYKIAKDVKVTVAPALMLYNAARATAPAGTNQVQFTDTASSTLPNGALSFLGETRNLIILNAPGDVSFKLGSLPTKLFWDFAWNARGRSRADDIYGLKVLNATTGQLESLHSSQDDFAYLIGLQIGQNKKKGDWSLLTNWRQTGLTAVDPNLNDSDFALGFVNTRGIQTAATYNLTDFATLGVNYYYAWNLRDDLVGGFATSGPAVANGNVIQTFQLELNIKF